MNQRVLPHRESPPIYGPCPVSTLAYGGLPPGGGYGSATEYEIGAQKIGEALHCILGSLHRAHPDFRENLRYEIRHIREEVALARKALSEYARDVYLEGLRGGGKEVQKSLQSIAKASPALKTAADKAAGRLSPDLPEPVFRVARCCYHAAAALAEAMQESVRFHPAVASAFTNPALSRPILELERLVVVLALRAGDRLPETKA